MPSSSLRHFVHTGAVCAGLLTFSAAAQAPLDIRVALVIGNSAYVDAPLANPVNDARSMGEALRGFGFTVVELHDTRKDQMAEAITKVSEALKGKHAVGMLYYAGHGLQQEWQNYMIPVDAKMSKASDVPAQAVNVNAVIDAFKAAGNRMNIVVLDACRDNPFAVSASSKGLAPVDAPPGTFLAYATAPGNVAEDGDAKSGNGLYTQFLLEELKRPTAKIEDMFKRVRLNVRRQSQGRQIPWESTSLEDDFYFNSKVKVPKAQPDDKVMEAEFLAENAEWDKIKDSKNPDDFYSFLQKHPSGFISEQAQFRIENLQKALTSPFATRDGILTAGPTTKRYELGGETVLDIVDGLTKTRRRVVSKVTYADDVRVEIGGGRQIWDQMGTVLKSADGTFTPGILQEPADIAVGKRWKTAYQNLRPDGVKVMAFWEYHVQGYETITVPAGTFRCFLVIGRGQSHTPTGVHTFEGRRWLDPATLHVVRLERVFRGSGGKIFDNTILELVSFKRTGSS